MTAEYTRPADMVKINPIFDKYFVEASTTLTRTYNSGLVNVNPMFNQFIAQTGGIVVQPFYKVPTSAAQMLGADIVPKRFSTSQRKVVSIGRADAFAVEDMAKYVSKDDPLKSLANDMAEAVVLERQRNLIGIMKGVSAVSGFAAKNVYTAQNSDEEVIKLSNTHVVRSIGKLGDQQSKIKYMLMHSSIYQALQEQNLISTIKSSENDVSFEVYMGKRVTVHDQVPYEETDDGIVYDTYLYGDGLIDMGIGLPEGGVTESDREMLPTSGRTTVMWRDLTMMAPTGFSFTGSPSAQFPTTAELATNSNWTMIFDPKNIPLVVIKALAE